MNDIAIAEGKSLDLIRRTVARDCNPAEFDQFVHICRAVRLDPLRRQIYAFVFSKDDPGKRQMTIVTAIGGYRAIADRTGNYRPGKIEVVLDDGLINPDTNPKGISHAVATVHKFAHGEWHEVEETAHWEEFAPIKEIWENREPSGRFQLDKKKDGWRRMPRVMISKCAEAQALRRAWPDDFAGIEVEEETDRRASLDLTASEMADAAESADRFARIGGPNAITVDWCDGEPLQRVPVGKFGDAVMAFIKDTPDKAAFFQQRNADALKEYWAKDKSGALDLKRMFESIPHLEAAE